MKSPSATNPIPAPALYLTDLSYNFKEMSPTELGAFFKWWHFLWASDLYLVYLIFLNASFMKVSVPSAVCLWLYFQITSLKRNTLNSTKSI
jgi:hypothetical protein